MEQNIITVVLDNTMKLYQLESPFWGLKYWEIAVGFFLCRLAVGIFRSLFSVGDLGAFGSRSESGYWKSKLYENKGEK